MDLEEYKKDVILPESWSYQNSNSKFYTGENQLLTVAHVEAAIRRLDFKPTINLRSDYSIVCEKLGVIPHPRLLKAQVSFFEYYSTRETAEQVAIQESERAQVAATLPGGIIPERFIELSTIRCDVPSFLIFMYLLCSRKSSIEAINLSNCQLNTDHFVALADLATNPATRAHFPPILRLDNNIVAPTASTFMIILKNMAVLDQNVVTSARAEICRYLWRRIKKIHRSVPVRPSVTGDLCRAIFNKWDTNRDSKVGWEEWVVGTDDLQNIDIFTKHVAFALLCLDGTGTIKENDFVELLGSEEAKELNDKAQLKQFEVANDQEGYQRYQLEIQQYHASFAAVNTLLSFAEPVSACLGKLASGACTNVRVLSLRASGIESRHLMALAEGLRTNTALRVLILSGNENLDDHGVQALAQAIRKDNRTLTHLDVSDCRGLSDLAAYEVLLSMAAVPVTDPKATQTAIKDLHGRAQKALQLIEKEESIISQQVNGAKIVDKKSGSKAKEEPKASDPPLSPRAAIDNPIQAMAEKLLKSDLKALQLKVRLPAASETEKAPLITREAVEAALKERIEECPDHYGDNRALHFGSCALRAVNFSRCPGVQNVDQIFNLSSYMQHDQTIDFSGTSASAAVLQMLVEAAHGKKAAHEMKRKHFDYFWAQRLELFKQMKAQQIQQQADQAAAEAAALGKKAPTDKKEVKVVGPSGQPINPDGEYAPLVREGATVRWL